MRTPSGKAPRKRPDAPCADRHEWICESYEEPRARPRSLWSDGTETCALTMVPGRTPFPVPSLFPPRTRVPPSPPLSVSNGNSSWRTKRRIFVRDGAPGAPCGRAVTLPTRRRRGVFPRAPHGFSLLRRRTQNRTVPPVEDGTSRLPVAPCCAASGDLGVQMKAVARRSRASVVCRARPTTGVEPT